MFSFVLLNVVLAPKNTDTLANEAKSATQVWPLSLAIYKLGIFKITLAGSTHDWAAMAYISVTES
jgi:hypothetical protein